MSEPTWNYTADGKFPMHGQDVWVSYDGVHFPDVARYDCETVRFYMIFNNIKYRIHDVYAWRDYQSKEPTIAPPRETCAEV